MTYGQGFGYGYGGSTPNANANANANAGAPSGGPQQPVPCARCGAAMTPQVASTTYSDAVPMRCGYCGAQEVLTNEGRVRVAQERIAMLRMAQDAAEAPARAAEQLVKMRPWLGGMLVGVPALFQAVHGTWVTVGALAQSPMDPSQKWQEIARACMMPAAGAGLGVGMMLGWYVALRRYRQIVEPERWARPPVTPGGAARCRCCGGDLPAQWGAFVECAFCRTPNMLDRALLARRDQLLGDETALHQQRAAGVIARANNFTQNFTRYSMIGALVGALVLAALGAVAAAVVVATL